MTGWEIYEAAEASIGYFWNLTRSQVHLELRRLCEDALVTKAGVPGTRERQPFRITSTGREAFVDWLTAWADRQPRRDLVRSPLLLTVTFGDSLSRPQFERFLLGHRLRVERRREELNRMLSAIPSSYTAPRRRRLCASRSVIRTWSSTGSTSCSARADPGARIRVRGDAAREHRDDC